MAKYRRMKVTAFSRIVVLILFYLFVVTRKTMIQYALFAVAAVWISLEVYEIASALKGRWKRKTNEAKEVTKKPEPELNGQDVFLIRQVNIRITELLKETYPNVVWLWESRPTVDAICQGGTWRICLQNADPFNYGDVRIDPRGEISISLLQIVELQEAKEGKSSLDDLTAKDLMAKPNVRQWYETNGEKCLMQLIDELNTQGHKRLSIREDGSVCITAHGESRVVDELTDFPPRMVWRELCQLLKEDQIETMVQADSLQLAW